MRLFYTAFWYLLLPLLLGRLWWRGRHLPAYRQRWRERLGWQLPQQTQPCIWVHAVSVGETIAALPVIESLLLSDPDTPVVVTTTTPTGSERVVQSLGSRVIHVYCPWDMPGALARFFNAFRPKKILVMETELWPNLVAAAHQRQVPVVLINGRLSEKSFRGYNRLLSLIRPMMQQMHLLLVQTKIERERFILLGAAPDKTLALGSIKFDMQLTPEHQVAAQQLRAQLNRRPVWIAASTHVGEDAIILAAHQQILQHIPDALLIIVPRHPERFESVAELIDGQGFSCVQRSHAQIHNEKHVDEKSVGTAQVYLGDTMGDMLLLYGAADVAFVAGSLLPSLGGHNLLEPALWAMPIISGPHVKNFLEISETLNQAGALSFAADEKSLAQVVVSLLTNDLARKKAGDAGKAVVEQNRGALDKLLAEINAI